MGDNLVDCALRSEHPQVRASEPVATVHWGSLQVTVRPKVTPGVGWSTDTYEAHLEAMWTTGFVKANVRPIELDADEAVALVSMLMLTCELPEQWVEEARF